MYSLTLSSHIVLIRFVSFQRLYIKQTWTKMIYYDFNGKRLADVQTLMMMTHFNKSAMIRLLKRKRVPYLTYQNRKIYFLSDVINEGGICSDSSEFTF